MDTRQNLYSTLKEIYFSIDNGDRRLLEGFNLSVPRFYLLKHIEENPGITLTQLSTYMLTDKSNITRLIKGVESEGLVRKQKHDTDGRALSLFLTETGRALVLDAIAAHRRFTEDRFEALNGETDELLTSLCEVKQLLEQQLESWADDRS